MTWMIPNGFGLLLPAPALPSPADAFRLRRRDCKYKLT